MRVTRRKCCEVRPRIPHHHRIQYGGGESASAPELERSEWSAARRLFLSWTNIDLLPIMIILVPNTNSLICQSG